jgi:hypothetical protein
MSRKNHRFGKDDYKDDPVVTSTVSGKGAKGNAVRF